VIELREPVKERGATGDLVQVSDVERHELEAAERSGPDEALRAGKTSGRLNV
jgi:hypothetical protein